MSEGNSPDNKSGSDSSQPIPVRRDYTGGNTRSSQPQRPINHQNSPVSHASHVQSANNTSTTPQHSKKQSKKSIKNIIPENFKVKIKKLTKKFVSICKHIYKTVLLPLLKRIWKILKKLPWKIILIVTAIILLITGLIFNFYIASTTRITDQYRQNYSEYSALDDSMQIANVYMATETSLKRDNSEALDSLGNLQQTADDTDVSLPARFISNYALRSYDVENQLDVIYKENSTENIQKISTYSAIFKELITSTNELLKKDIVTDTTGYIVYLNESTARIAEIEKNNEELDIQTIGRIYSQILSSAEDYRATKNQPRFDDRFSNVSSELYKEIIKSWDKTMKPLYEWSSAQKSSFESILGSIDQQN